LKCEDYDKNLLLDDAAEINTDEQQNRWHGKIDVILHPIYRVPHPYLQVFDSQGEAIDVGQVQQAIDEFNKVDEFCTSNSRSKPTDISLNLKTKGINGGRLSYEEHPYICAPCISLHLCELPSLLHIITKDLNEARRMSTEALAEPEILISVDFDSTPSADVLTEDNETGSPFVNTHEQIEHCHQVRQNYTDLYLLHWFVVVGPSIGLQISPSMFEHIRHHLMNFSTQTTLNYDTAVNKK
jgi:hypothetical protein